MPELTSDYSAEVDTVDGATWDRMLLEFRDANLFQTWSYGSRRWGDGQLSHVVLRKNGQVVALAQARLLKFPLLGGVAYVSHGPLWRCRGMDAGAVSENLRQIVRALHNEYASRRGLFLMVLPYAYDGDDTMASIIESERLNRAEPGKRTYCVDLSPPLGEIRKNLIPRWRTELNRSEKNGLTVLDGSSLDLFDMFAEIYADMKERKGFEDFLDLDQFRQIQDSLPQQLKMQMMICTLDNEPIASAVTSHLGDTAIAIFWATNLLGRKMKAGYLLQWRLIESLKSKGCAVYEMGGVNWETNPGGSRFKAGLAGKSAHEMSYSVFEGCTSIRSLVAVNAGRFLRTTYRRAVVGSKRLSRLARRRT